MAQKTRFVGLDVAKSKVDACIRSEGLRMSAASTPEGEAELVAWVRANRVGRAVMEASGGYERGWAEALRAAGVEVRIVDPKRVRHFAKAAGRLAKNDPIDADTIARFAEAFPGDSVQPHDPALEVLARLVQALGMALKDVEERIKQQREHRPPAIVVQALAAVAKCPVGRTAQARGLDRFQDQGESAFGILPSSSTACRGSPINPSPASSPSPPKSGASAPAASALLGAAPYDDDSGQRKGVRSIRGGRRKLRDLLYVPVMGAATRHNPVLKAYYQRLRARGKEAKVALIACMRKLIVILNTMLARDQTWNPPARAAA